LAVTSSGEVSIADVVSEFNLGTSQGVDFDDLRYIDPWLAKPQRISYEPIHMTDFYAASVKSASITMRPQNNDDEINRAGYGTYKGHGFTVTGGESGASVGSFGSISRALYFSTGQQLTGIVFEGTVLSSENTTGAVNIFKRGSGNNGWSKIKFRFNDKPWRYGDVTSVTDIDEYDVELSRTDADSFSQIDGTQHNGTYAYGWRYAWTGYNSTSDIGKIASMMRTGLSSGQWNSNTNQYNSNGYFAIKIVV